MPLRLSALPESWVTPVPLPEQAQEKPRIVEFPGAFRPRLDADDAAAIFRHRPPEPRRRRLGDVLVETGRLDSGDLARALDLQLREGAMLGEVLVRHGMLDEDALLGALSEQLGIGRLDVLPPADAAIVDLARILPQRVAIDHVATPIGRIGGWTLIATAAPERLDALRRAIPADLAPCRFVIAPRAAVEARLTEILGNRLARQAECRPPRALSCRDWRHSRAGMLVTAFGIGTLACLLSFPLTVLQVATLTGLAAMAVNLGLRIAAIRAGRAPPGPAFESPRSARMPPGPVPRISILVPMHDEPDIATSLIRRMDRLDYPRSALELLFVLEEGDIATRDALEAADLPGWMRVIPVPDGHPRTKPRAMNYALNFARGEIVGIYDAEDAPDPEQLVRVAARFATAGPDLACLQGRLDYYNARRNWMARCFAIEYATWFRLFLPGIAKLGLVVPLGGTTLFFRRRALEQVGAWDAHNVTEDADLGVRLARSGYRTEVIDITTMEEANAAPLPWIRQRSRWMKGYMMTWAVHAARPAALLADLGLRRTLGFHALFLGSILNALLLPFMWSTLVLSFGFDHPVVRGMPDGFALALAVSMPALTLLNIAVGWIACRAPHHRGLRPWLPTMELYFPLATLAVSRALVELVLRPFHWEKTSHGAYGGTDDDPEPQPLPTLPVAPAPYAIAAE